MSARPHFTKRRAAVKKIAWVEPVCLECDQKAVLMSGLLAFPHRPERARDLFWKCRCGATVSCHPGTGIAMGRPCGPSTSRARSEAHAAFDALWMGRAGKGSKAYFRARTNAYRWLAEQMGLPFDEVHFGWFDRATCLKARELCRAELAARRAA